MIEHRELLSMVVFLVVFLLTGGLGGVALFRMYGDHRRAISRLRDLSASGTSAPAPGGMGRMARSALPKIGNLVLPSSNEELDFLKTRLTRAGIYGPSAVHIFLGMRILLMVVLPLAASVLPYLLGLLTAQRALVLGVVAVAVGMLTPSVWLDYQRRRRQDELRRALPDILDMLVLCVEAGVSLIAAFQRVTQEVQLVHPGLAKEMNIIQREIQLGLSIGDALLKFGDRCDMDEVRQLAQIILQSERYGTSSVKALRVHSETSRQVRQQRAEEKAQKAAVQILFPTLLCIFPAIFIVILGPAAYQIAGMFSGGR